MKIRLQPNIWRSRHSPKDSLNMFEEVRDCLLREIRLSPEQYRDRFHNAAKSSEETYTCLVVV